MCSLPLGAVRAVVGSGGSHRARLLFIVLTVVGLAVLPGPSSADEGWASWYGEPFHGRVMYGGQIYNMNDPTTTACNIFPLGTWLKVTNPANGHSVVVQVRDRGAFKHALDLSYAAFAALDNPAKMMIRVQYEVVTGPDGAPAAATPVPAPSATQAKPTPSPTPTKAPTEYTVAPGDTLVSIAERFGLSTGNLVEWNDIPDPDLVVVGQSLALRAPQASGAVAATARGGSGHAQPAGVHVVAEGDTLWSIAARYNTSPEALAALNGLDDANIIVVGQSLRVSEPSDEVESTAASSTGEYVVQEGDTLFGIALSHDTTVQSLLELNGLDDPDLIQVGQVLCVP